jgi:hypothetical protein
MSPLGYAAVIVAPEANGMVCCLLFTSESVAEGHPDHVVDQISDAILDAVLSLDPSARVERETLVTRDLIVIAREISADASVDYEPFAKNIVAAGLGERCEVQIAYAIGVGEPVSLILETFGRESAVLELVERVVEEQVDLSRCDPSKRSICEDRSTPRPRRAVTSAVSTPTSLGRTPPALQFSRASKRTGSAHAALRSFPGIYRRLSPMPARLHQP